MDFHDSRIPKFQDKFLPLPTQDDTTIQPFLEKQNFFTWKFFKQLEGNKGIFYQKEEWDNKTL